MLFLTFGRATSDFLPDWQQLTAAGLPNPNRANALRSHRDSITLMPLTIASMGTRVSDAPPPPWAYTPQSLPWGEGRPGPSAPPDCAALASVRSGEDHRSVPQPRAHAAPCGVTGRAAPCVCLCAIVVSAAPSAR